MDKNTITGLLLMGLVIFAFTWLNKPTEEELAARKATMDSIENARAAESAERADKALALDTLSAEDVSQLKAVVSQCGTRKGDSVEFSSNTINLTYSAGNALSGTVALADTVVSVDDVLAKRLNPKLSAEASKILKTEIVNATKYKSFSAHLAGKDSTVVLENNLLKVDIASKGAMISQAVIKGYDSKRNGTKDLVLFTKKYNKYEFILNGSDVRYRTGDFYFVPTQDNDSTVTFTLALADGAQFAIRYTLPKDSYLVKMEVLQKDMNKVIPNNVSDMDFVWEQELARHEQGDRFEESNSGLYYKFAGDNVENLNFSGDEQKEESQAIRWIGFKDQFFSSVLIAHRPFISGTFHSVAYERGEGMGVDFLKNLSANATLEYLASNPNPATFTFFFGPNKYSLLSSYDNVVSQDEDLNMTKLIPLGWSIFRWINTLIVIPVFNILGNWISNYGIIILIMTLLIKIVLFPLAYKSLRSSAVMKVLAPDIKAINDKYPGQENAMLRSQKTMALYSKAGANPMSGCLPMLLQMPILFAIFSFFPSCIELRGEPFLWVKDLSAPDVIFSWETQIPIISTYFGNHISLFCLLMTVTNLIYTRLTMQSQASTNSMPGMQGMMYLMPVMFLVFFNSYAAGLSYYYFLSLLITIVQTFVIRHYVTEDRVRATMAKNDAKPKKKKSGFMARLEEAQKLQQEMARQKAQQQKGKRK